MQEEGKEPEEDGTIHEMRVHGDADNRHNKGHKEQIKVYKERGINVNDDRARDGKRCVGMLLKHGIWVEITLFGGIEVEGYLRKASAEELKDYQRYYLAFEECENIIM